MGGQEKERPDEGEMNVSFVEDRYPFAQKEQRVQKIFLVLMCGFLAMGMAGLFGDGYLSDQNISGTNYDVEYHQFIREETTTELFVNLKDAADTTVVSINRDYIKHVRVEQVVPEPESVETQANSLSFTFTTANTGLIIFYLRPERSGVRNLEMEIQNELKQFSQFVFF